MAYRLGEYVVYGEIYNTNPYDTHGFIALRGEAPGKETVLRINLTGDCDPDLKGKFFRFMPGEGDSPDAVFRETDFPGFQIRQIGPTGDMSAEGWVRTLPCPVEEFLSRSELGEPPPTFWKRRLYLEWYGQNGRVVIEMAGPTVEECVRFPVDRKDPGEWKPLLNLAIPPEFSDRKAPAGPEITVFRKEGDDFHIETWEAPEPAGDDEDDASTLSDLQRQLDAEAAAIDRALWIDDAEPEDPDDSIREFKLIDDCIEHGVERPLSELLCDPDTLRPPEEMNDEEVEAELKALLGRMAMIGVALDVCAHYTPRDCYRLMKDTLLRELDVFEELVGTGWVTHLMTHEYCPECEAEIEREIMDLDGDTGSE